MNEQARVYTSEQLKGLTGDNGEKYCLFVRNLKNPLNSGWLWFADKWYAESIAYKINHNLYDRD